MISATSFDIQVLGELGKKDPSPQPDHFIIVYVNEKEVLRSERTRRVPAPRWKEKQLFHFDVGSTIKIVIFRRSLLAGRLSLKKYFVAKYTGRGIDLLANSCSCNSHHRLTDESGHRMAPCISIKLDFAFEDHTEFMKTVDGDMLRLAKVNGADGAQIATSIGGQLGTVLQKIVPIIDTFARTRPVLNTVWIVLSSAYKVMQNQIALDDDVRELVDILGEMAGAAASCPKLPKIGGTVDIIEDIGKTSLDVALLIHQHADPSIAGKPSILARTAKLSVSNIPSQVAECRRRCVALILILRGRVRHDANPRVRGIQDTQKKENIQKWMRAPDSSPNYNAARAKHQADTGSWFIDGAEFTEWKEEPGCVLWLDGGPGCGKTITCATSIENVIDSCAWRPSVGYAYFFFDGTSARSDLKSHENLLKSIITQLADRCEGIPVALEEMYRTCDTGHRQPDLPSLEKTLLAIVDGFDVAYIVIDSLDECAERPKVLKWIQSITSKAGKLHMMVTSRPEWEIESALLSLSRMRRISIAGNPAAQCDIPRFINAKLSKLPTWSEERKKKVGDVLGRDTDGMFRWVALQFDELIKCRNEEQLDKQLKSLPRDLNETYSQILERSSERDDIIRFLQWLAHSRQAMTVQEIAAVALIDFGKDDSAVPVYKDARRYDDPKDVLSICAGLVSEIGGTVQLAHFSVYEYLASLNSTDVAPGVTIGECASHSIIVQTCLAYLQHFDQPGSITAAKIKYFPLAQYAADHWAHHFHYARADINNDTALQNLVLDFFRPAAHCALINCIRIRDKDFQREADAFAAPLYYACCFGLAEVVRFHIDHGANMYAEAGRGTVLAAAASNNHLDIVKLLVEKGAHIDTEGGERYSSALVAASYNGSLEIIKFLMESGAHLDTKRGDMYDAALRAACSQGHFKIVELLVENGAGLETEEKTGWSDGRVMNQYGTPLVLASLSGELASVKILIDKKVLLDAEGGETVKQSFDFCSSHQARHGTALVLASLKGHLDIVKILAENGALLDTEGWETEDMDTFHVKEARHGTALVLASLKNNLDVVKILVENGALLDTEGSETQGQNVWRGTALEAASANGHLEIAELLSKAASDRTARHAAEGGEAPAEILAETGKVDDEPDETPEVGSDGDGSSISANADLAVATLSFGTYHHILIILSLVSPILLTYWMHLH